jgi:hypothetical protein
MTGTRVRAWNLWLLLGGFTIWAVAFAAIYGLNGLGCEAGWYRIGQEPLTLQRVLLTAASLVSIAAIGLLWLYIRRRLGDNGRDPRGASGFLETSGLYATIAAFVAALFTFAPTIALSTCI